MGERSNIVDLFERDLSGFIGFLKVSRGTFCKEYRLNKSLFTNLKIHKHTPTIETMDKVYAAMAEAGFESIRSCCDTLFLAALVGEDGDVLAAREALKACYEDAGQQHG